MKPIEHLKELIRDEAAKTHPSFPRAYIPVNTYDTLKPEKRELKRIERFCDLMPNVKMNRIENTGKRIDNTKIIGSVMGGRKIGSIEYRHSQMQNGLADLVGLIQGRYYAVELKRIYKNGKDRQSLSQKQYQKEVEDAGGVYKIVTSFNDFYEWYMKNFVK